MPPVIEVTCGRAFNSWQRDRRAHEPRTLHANPDHAEANPVAGSHSLRHRPKRIGVQEDGFCGQRRARSGRAQSQEIAAAITIGSHVVPPNVCDSAGIYPTTILFGWVLCVRSMIALRLDDLAAAQTRGADANALRPAFHFGANRAQIDVPAPFGHVMGVADVVSKLRPLAANLTNLCHVCSG